MILNAELQKEERNSILRIWNAITNEQQSNNDTKLVKYKHTTSNDCRTANRWHWIADWEDNARSKYNTKRLYSLDIRLFFQRMENKKAALESLILLSK